MKVIIISGGDIADYEYAKSFISKNDFIICADSGYTHAINMNIEIDVLIGDFDSIKEIPKKEIIKIEFPKDKDYTDTELALKYAKEKGFENILMLGAIGSRVDHTLANIFLLIRFKNVIIINEKNKIIIGNNVILNEDVGAYVSILPITECININTKNLKYPLINATMMPGHTIGISNVILNKNASINIEKGCAIIIISRD